MTERIEHPWRTLWVMIIGFFMILLDTTIVAVANPAILRGLHSGIDSVLWATSAYLLSYAVPLLVTGRLGDRFGQKNVYLAGLAVFTVSSLACGLAGSIEALIVARVFQGLGAALISPQTMAVITRVFPREHRGAAMGVWGATAGIATLVGPILGGLLVDSLGWEWIFFINVPVGVAGFVLGVLLVPGLPSTSAKRFDVVGILLSAFGMFLLVFGIQEGEKFDWGVIWGPVSVWGLIAAGVAFFVAFVFWEARTRSDPLVPLGLFRDRNFSLANLAVSGVGFAITAFPLPLIFYLQLVRGLTPTQAALVMAPTAVVAGITSPFIGKLSDTVDPKWLAVAGTAAFAACQFWVAGVMTPDAPLWALMIPAAVQGASTGCIWGPISLIATRDLEPKVAGAGSGVFNATRQLGSVLGSACISLAIQANLVAELGGTDGTGGAGSSSATGADALPDFIRAPYSAAMAHSQAVPAVAMAVVCLVALGFAAHRRAASRATSRASVG